jgi:hypothetical protein
MKPKDLARRAGMSVSAVYACERFNHGGRTKTLIRLAGALGLTLRMPDFAEIAVDAGLTETNLAETSGLAFDTVRSLIHEPTKGNVRTLEVLAWALKAPLVLVV